MYISFFADISACPACMIFYRRKMKIISSYYKMVYGHALRKRVKNMYVKSIDIWYMHTSTRICGCTEIYVWARVSVWYLHHPLAHKCNPYAGGQTLPYAYNTNYSCSFFNSVALFYIHVDFFLSAFAQWTEKVKEF